MLTDQHPITPPEGLIEALRSQAPQCDVDAGVNKVRETQLVIAAYRAGADYELEEILLYPGVEPEDCRFFDWVSAANIRAWRRPKPPSLAEEALEAQQRVWKGSSTHADWELICTALEWLSAPCPSYGRELRAARRPKPLGLAEEARAKLDEAVMRGDCISTTTAMPILRRALERLQELENNG